MRVNDDLLMPLHDLVVTLCEGARADDREMDGAMIITALSLDLPIELRAKWGDDQRLQILASPPTQRINTTFLPIFHRLRVRITSNTEIYSRPDNDG